MSDDEQGFWFTLPKHDGYPPFPGSFEVGERLFLERLEETGSLDAVNCLIQHYRLHRREDLARRALLCVYASQSAERSGRFDDAIVHYTQALALEPCEIPELDGWLNECRCAVAFARRMHELVNENAAQGSV
jgi:hypothetical protein